MTKTAEIVQMFQRQMEEQRKQTEALVNAIAKGMDHSVPRASIPSVSPFDSMSELWSDYWARFQTFVNANSIPADKVAQVFLTNQTKVTYKLLSNMAVQQLPPKTINELDIDAIAAYMQIQFDPRGARTFQVLAITVIVETEEAAKVAKETVHGSTGRQTEVVNMVQDKPMSLSSAEGSSREHAAGNSPFKETICHYCQKAGHLHQSVCLKRKNSQPVNIITKMFRTIKAISSTTLQQCVKIEDQYFNFEVDTGADDNFCLTDVWCKLGKPTLITITCVYEVANGQSLHTLGTFLTKVSLQAKDSGAAKAENVSFTVTEVPRLNLLGWDAIIRLGVNIPALLGVSTAKGVDGNKVVQPVTAFKDLKPDTSLQEACNRLCLEFPDLFKHESGCLKDVMMEIKFKMDASPVFCKPHVVPFAIQDDLVQAHEAGIAKGVWKSTQFNSYGTPVVPILKKPSGEGSKPQICVCGDYSVSQSTVGASLVSHAST
eukprot:Em0013g499a